MGTLAKSAVKTASLHNTTNSMAEFSVTCDNIETDPRDGHDRNGLLGFQQTLAECCPQLQAASFSLSHRLEPIKTPGTLTNSNRMTKSNYFS